MWQYNYSNDYLCHWGIKGMKWGVRRYQNEDGTLTPAGVRRYAIKGYSKDSLDSNETLGGKVYDLYSGAHKLYGKAKYDTSSDAQNRKRAEQYIRDKNSARSKQEKKDSSQSEKSRLRKNIVKTETVRIASKAASKALHEVAKTQYSKYKENAGPYRAYIVNGAEAASKVLNEISDMAAVSAFSQKYKYATTY